MLVELIKTVNTQVCWVGGGKPASLSANRRQRNKDFTGQYFTSYHPQRLHRSKQTRKGHFLLDRERVLLDRNTSWVRVWGASMSGGFGDESLIQRVSPDLYLFFKESTAPLKKKNIQRQTEETQSHFSLFKPGPTEKQFVLKLSPEWSRRAACGNPWGTQTALMPAIKTEQRKTNRCIKLDKNTRAGNK